MRKPHIGMFCEGRRTELERIDLLRLKLCYANGVDAIFFYANDLDKEKETVNAYIWTKEGITRETTLLPVFLEYGSGTRERRYFRSRCSLIDDFNLSKQDVNNLLLKSEFASSVIPSLYTQNPQEALSFLSLWKEVIIKPLAGARGEGIISVKQAADGCYIFTDTKEEVGTFNQEESVKLLSEMYNDTIVIVQPRIGFTNKDGNTMDFRVNVSKNGSGEWETVFIIPRTSRYSIVSNFSSGGCASLLRPTLELDYKENAKKVFAELKRIAQKLPPMIEAASDCKMLSLGIDVGFDYESLNPYIIEVNYVPKITFPDMFFYYGMQAEYFAWLIKEYLKDSK